MATGDTRELTLDETNLRSTHILFEKYFEEWRFLNAAYEGVRALIAYGALYKHERESEANYQRRQKVAYGFSYSKSVVDIFNSYLFKKEFPKELPEALTKDEQWMAFQKDCNLEGDEFDEFFVDQQRDASILGHVGLLVDKPMVDAENRAEEKEENIYPYVVAYKPMAILDWQYTRDGTGRRILTYLKVLDDDERYRVWTPETWEVWEIQEAQGSKEVHDSTRVGEQPTKSETTGKGATAVKVGSGENELGEIPWVWLYNQRSNIDKEVGVSDIVDVARIDSSIIRNLSQIEEVIDYAAFPMMRKPMPESGQSPKDEVGPTAVLEFDPDKPETKPDWLDSTVEGPVKAILEVIATKIGEIYRSSNIGGMAATEISTSAKSGVALKTEFQLLNSKLVKKGKNVSKAKEQVTVYWLKWQDEYERYKGEVKYDHVKTFEVEDLATDLENILTGSVLVTQSVEFKKQIQKLVVRLILPTLDEQVLAEIDKEIDDGTYEGIGAFAKKNMPPDEVPPGPADEFEEEDESNVVNLPQRGGQQ